MFKTKNQKGFTLIEILIVIGIIAVLATIVIIAINPAKQFAQARNTQRSSNVNTILNAIGQRVADNKGLFPTAAGCSTALVAGTTYTIATGTVGGIAVTPLLPATAVIDMSCLTPTYIPVQLPVDPSTGVWEDSTHYNTQYNVTVNATGNYTVCAPKGAEAAIPLSSSICVTR